MPFLDFGEDEDEPDFKFPECASCTNRNKPGTCRDCDAGEFFEEEEPEGLDGILRF